MVVAVVPIVVVVMAVVLTVVVMAILMVEVMAVSGIIYHSVGLVARTRTVIKMVMVIVRIGGNNLCLEYYFMK